MQIKTTNQEDKMISLEVLLGRPASGKTAHAIKILNEHGKDSLIITLQNQCTWLRGQGLCPAVTVLDLQPALVSAEVIIVACQKSGARLVVIDNLELLPAKILIEDLQQQLEHVGVRRLVLTSHLRRDMVPACQKRLEHTRYTTVLVSPPS
jgi:DNA transposition AAA+ family ATPase